MSTHQTGWSDEELIALADLRVNRQAAPAQRPSHLRQPSERQTQARTIEPRWGRSQSSSAAPKHARERIESQLANLDGNFRKLLPSGPGRAPVAEDLARKIAYPLHGATAGIFSRKGGVGKTTIAAYLGLMLASLRDGPVVAIDGDSASGSLGWMLAPRSLATLDDLAGMRPVPQSPRDFAPFITRTRSGLDVVLSSTSDDTPIDDSSLSVVVKNLTRNYEVSLFDTGTATAFTSGRSLLNQSRVLLLVTGVHVDSVRAAERTLAWLDERSDTTASPTPVIAVLNGIPPSMRPQQIESIEKLFAHRCAAVARIPWDQHLAGGTRSANLDQLAKPTQVAFQQLAATTIGVLARSLARPRVRPVHA